MKVLILRSRRHAPDGKPKDAYTQVFTSTFAERVIGNLRGRADFCTACGDRCTGCRKPYRRRLGRQIAGILALPGALPYLLERPDRYVPRRIPRHDVLLAFHIHEQILLEILKRCGDRGTRGVVAPVESGDWISPSIRRQVQDLCRQASIEAALPKPFCAFDPPDGSLLSEFRRRFHIGKPEVELTVKASTIERAYVHVSAACGATYFVAQGLVGRSLHDDLRHAVVAKRLHSYPCTASMAWDDQIGDTIMHVAGQAHYEILAPLGAAPQAEPQTVVSPLGRPLPKPRPAQEGIENIEKAKATVLEHLADGRPASLRALKRKCDVPAAAVDTAVLILKQEGKIRTEAGKITRA